jgi:hypothetical protein
MNRQLKYGQQRPRYILFKPFDQVRLASPDWVTRPEVRVGSEKRRNDSSNRGNREVSTIFA